VFSEDLVLQRIDTNTPGNGLPPSEQDRRAGTHSGFITTLRIAAADDNFSVGTELLQYEATFLLNAVAGLMSGQVTARWVLTFLPGQPEATHEFAITGGTEAYKAARGQMIESRPPGSETYEVKKLEIVM
jgi:hypothetical protein